MFGANAACLTSCRNKNVGRTANSDQIFGAAVGQRNGGVNTFARQQHGKWQAHQM